MLQLLVLAGSYVFTFTVMVIVMKLCSEYTRTLGLFMLSPQI